MNPNEYRMIAIGWFGLIIVLTVFWYATLKRLTGILNEHLKSTTGQAPFTGAPSIISYLLKGSFEKAGDQRLTGLCRRLRQLLYGYLGAIGAYFVFLVIMHPPY